VPVLSVLHLTPDKQKALEHLLLERQLTLLDTHDIMVGQNATSGAIDAATKSTTEEVDASIVAEIGPDAYQELKSILDSKLYLSQVILNKQPRLEQQGAPLSPQQLVQTAVALRQTYDIAVNRSTLAIDPASGLTILDQQGLQRMSAFLRPEQLEIFRSSFVATNRNLAANRSSLEGK